MARATLWLRIGSKANFGRDRVDAVCLRNCTAVIKTALRRARGVAYGPDWPPTAIDEHFDLCKDSLSEHLRLRTARTVQLHRYRCVLRNSRRASERVRAERSCRCVPTRRHRRDWRETVRQTPRRQRDDKQQVPVGRACRKVACRSLHRHSTRPKRQHVSNIDRFNVDIGRRSGARWVLSGRKGA